MHIAFLSLHEYFKINKNLPKNNNEELTNILKISKNIYEINKYKWCNKININEDYLKEIFKYSKFLISPICGYGGGVVSQEIIKFTGIFKPINQWFKADFSGILDKILFMIILLQIVQDMMNKLWFLVKKLKKIWKI